MTRRSVLLLAASLLSSPALQSQERPGLFLREDWKETPSATPVTQDHVANPDLMVTRYGPGEAGIKKSHHDQPADDPYYIWSGTADGNWAMTLKHKAAWVDLTGQSKVRWRTKQAGFRQLRIVLKLADGRWLVSDQFDEASEDWRVREFNLADVRWRRLDIKTVVEGPWEPHPDLSKVEEIGWTDLMTGGASAGCSRLDWIEVYGRPVSKPK
ncbi:MAG: hypothetical protein AB1898_26015 [Acidobacteriota bacterium]